MDLDVQLARFHENGYLLLPGFLPAPLVERLVPEVDRWVDRGLRQVSIDACADSGSAPPPLVELEMDSHAELAAYEPLLELLETESLLGRTFVFHHLHSDRRLPGGSGKAWHHDYEQHPQKDRDHPMVHALHYIEGLRPGMGALALLPGSHRQVAEKDAWSDLGTAEQPGEVVIDDLPPGSTVLLHSALFHTRRAASDARSDGRHRYMIDASYCRTGVLWPPVKPYWRAVLDVGRRRRLGGGRRPDLFAERHFSEYPGTGWGPVA
ncbi:phytanoyl-CoA dioxygenase family protein [Streptomyces sp. NPDC102402]|uniref:phytanoyl-CoA dioxygenase family protein n=1 Tax=Streptomyces sp. NPDC102402 TaxID=3366169 RepID=UPI0038252660